MSDNTQTEPVMDGANEATDDEKLAGLITQVDHDHGVEDGASKAGHVQDRLDDRTGENPIDTEA